MTNNQRNGVYLPPAVGYSLKILLWFFHKNYISAKYYHRLIILGLINLINLPFRTYERLFINPRFKTKPIVEDPIFIIGHWRSGTTYLHNIMCKDPQMGYTTTFQSVFPDTIFNKIGFFLFMSFTKLLIPRKRKGDNVVMDPSFPQEEEFALGANTPICFYYFWMFPRKIMEYYSSFVRMDNLDAQLYDNWKNDYKLLIKKALKNTNGNIYLSKNPTNTGRIKVLLDMFPNAKFIHIHRNPVEVILSTRNFYRKMMPPLQLQKVNNEEIESNILELYKNIMTDFSNQKGLIPEGKLIEISYDDLERNPKEVMRNIYEKLGIRNYNVAKPFFQNYFNSQNNYMKNRYKISNELLHKIITECVVTIKNYNYAIPKNVELLDE